MTPRRYWTKAEVAVLRARYPHEHTATLATLFGRDVRQVYQKAERLGILKSAEYLASPLACRLRRGDPLGEKHRFKPGHKTWNKGLKGSTGLHEKTRAHHYKPGNISGRAAQLVAPVGALRVNSEGTLDRKISTEPGACTRRWRAVHRLVWEAAHGPVPAGMVVVFKPGRKSTDVDTITLDALELISRAENMKRNSFLTRYPPEIARLIQLRGALSRQINRKAKEAAE